MFHCAKSGYTHMRHDAIRDILANIMDEGCYDVEIKPHLKPDLNTSIIFRPQISNGGGKS